MRISIITPTTADSCFADEAIASVRHDEYADIEHIVVHDGDIAFVDSLKLRHPELRIMIGPGKGPGPAVAAAIAVATGDFILQLNSDDRLARGGIARFAACASMRPEERIWTGGARVFRIDANGNEEVLRIVEDRDATALSLGNILDDLPLLTARFVHRSIYEQIGGLDDAYPFSNDREFLLRAVIAGVTDAPLSAIVSEMREHDASRTINRRRGSPPPYLGEHLAIANHWLAKEDLPDRLRRSLRSWRARETLRLAIFQMRAGRVGAAMRTIVRAERDDKLWACRATSSLSAWRRRRR